jgi:hypothetical protein
MISNLIVSIIIYKQSKKYYDPYGIQLEKAAISFDNGSLTYLTPRNRTIASLIQYLIPLCIQQALQLSHYDIAELKLPTNLDKIVKT